MRVLSIGLLAGVLLAAASPARAQQAIDYASVSGRVTDPSGAVVPGVEISARQVDTNLAVSVVSDRHGRFRFPYLRVGPYEITARGQGFTEATRALTLTLGAAFEITLVLTVPGVDASVNVSAGATVLDAARSQIAATVSEPEVRSVPSLAAADTRCAAQQSTGASAATCAA